MSSSVNIEISPKSKNPVNFDNTLNSDGFNSNNSHLVPRYNTLKAENINIDIAPVRENYNDQMFNLPQKRPIRGKVEVRLL